MRVNGRVERLSTGLLVFLGLLNDLLLDEVGHLGGQVVDLVFDSGHAELIQFELLAESLHLFKLGANRVEMVQLFQIGRHRRDACYKLGKLTAQLSVPVEVALDFLLEFLRLHLNLLESLPVFTGHI